jgi:hypothetical protein
VHAVQPQLARQHHAGRSAAGDDHVNHETSHATRLHFRPLLRLRASLISLGSGFGRRLCGTTRGLPQAPRCAIN